MPNRLADAISPYLRSHADNPVDWQGWGAEAFEEARARDVPVLVSIGYSTCHWCHVMARESFSDPDLASYLNEHFVSVKVDREEHPDVDAAYLAAASAFVGGLGWPLNVFVTPEGRAFYVGTYFPPQPMSGHPSFRQVLEAVTDAWTTRRMEVTESADLVAEALATASRQGMTIGARPDATAIGAAAATLVAQEDPVHGGFGDAPKFPVAPVLGFLLDRADRAEGTAGDRAEGTAGDRAEGRSLALRTLKRLGASPLRDPIEGGFFRYAVNRDWSEPHYERMLYDNAQLLDLYTQAWKLTGEPWARAVAEGIARFLTSVLALPGAGFASGQDSESTVDGLRVEGGYYTLDEDARKRQPRPALDAKVLTGWNGLAIAALARAGFAFDDLSLRAAATGAADKLLDQHLLDPAPGGTRLVRASTSGRVSGAQATLEDYGMFARGLLELALATGEVRYAVAARHLVDATLPPAQDPLTFRAPNGADPVLAAQGLDLAVDPSEGAYPSGLTAIAGAAWLLHLLTAEPRYLAAAKSAMAVLGGPMLARPLAFGAALRLSAALLAPVEQLVVVSPDGGPADTGPVRPVSPPAALDRNPGGLLVAARLRATGLVAAVTEAQAKAFAEAGFGLFRDRTARAGVAAAYVCRDVVCSLPVTDPADLPAGTPGSTGRPSGTTMGA
ncbi:thioredoxin domain-containing protein [Cryobacterium fucosi]|uniref:Thioredoxin domain-containing protein n=1 Tax=Cryobacterium fucosi TaxID=1259157 RepID=A0A4R9BFE6_9MICO|nr:DUF255 domain-containing protein [Cryobacterium fucosi]TFD82567.1 thioredoxin domain-containing protein [Cryobacterium fucosi]